MRLYSIECNISLISGKMKRWLLCLLVCFSLSLQAQSILDIKLDSTAQGKSLLSVINEIQRKDSVKFFFLPEWIETISFNRDYAGQSLAVALDDLFQDTELSYFLMYPTTVVIVKDPQHAMRRQSFIESARQQQKKIVQQVFGNASLSNKTTVGLSGQLIDLKSREPLPGASIQVSDSPLGTTTDENGNYNLLLNVGSHVLSFGFVEYENVIVDLLIYEDAELHLEMEKVPILLDEVLIQYQAAKEITTSRIGQSQLIMREIKRAPAFLGEPDLIKQVQTLPGVTTVGEAAAGFNVRGGSVDQNLILFDGLPLFNSSHVFGFLSAFNSDAIRDVSFYRGGIPAEYGGRVSSVLDIHSRDGDFEQWHLKAGIGMVTNNIMIDGPLRKDKTSIAASFRSTYSNWLLNSLRTNYIDLRNSSVFFYDGTLKLSHIFNDQTRLALSSYSSKDSFRLLGDSTYHWDNLQGSARLDHQFSPKLSSEFVLGRSVYGYSVENSNELTSSELSYRIATTLLKAGFNYQHGLHKFNFGGQITHYLLNPGTLKPTSSESNARSFALDNQYSIENAIYFADDWSYNEHFFVEAGIRIPLFTSFGPASVNIYQEGAAREVINITDTLQFKRGEAIKTYLGVEPRLSLRWMTGPTASVKLGYNRMYQFIHLVSNTTAVTPVDIWQPSGYYFKPQRADQISLGFFKDLFEKAYGSSIEAFYKDIDNVLDFKDGAQLILNEQLEADLLQGKAYSYGIETFLSKNTGRLTGNLNYTYSRAFRRIEGASSFESINNGKRYPANFDQPHILNLTWKYSLSRRHFFTGSFTYHTGRPVTIPISLFSLENTSYAYFSERNQYRIPDYHRLDLALVIEGNHKRRKWMEGTWVFSVYNVYGRENPYTVFFKSSGTGIPVPYQLSIIGTVFPSVSYNFKI